MRRIIMAILLFGALSMVLAGCDFGEVENFFTGNDDEAQAATTPPPNNNNDDDDDDPPPTYAEGGTVTVVCLKGILKDAYFDSDEEKFTLNSDSANKLVHQQALENDGANITHTLRWVSQDGTKSGRYDFDVNGDMTLMVMKNGSNYYVTETPITREVIPEDVI